MAKRYSGDVEVRVTLIDGGARTYVASVRAPGERGRARVTSRDPFVDPASPEAYDRVARRVLEAADEAARGSGEGLPLERDGRGRPLVRRTYQSPCPVPRSAGQAVARRTKRRSR